VDQPGQAAQGQPVPTVLQPRLVELCARRFPAERLFGEGRDRHSVYYHVQWICRLAKVPVVCTQGLRGTQSTISIEAVSVEHVAAALGQKGRASRGAPTWHRAPSSQARKVEQLIAGRRDDPSALDNGFQNPYPGGAFRPSAIG
jgi:hypothetical protein